MELNIHVPVYGTLEWLNIKNLCLPCPWNSKDMVLRPGHTLKSL